MGKSNGIPLVITLVVQYPVLHHTPTLPLRITVFVENQFSIDLTTQFHGISIDRKITVVEPLWHASILAPMQFLLGVGKAVVVPPPLLVPVLLPSKITTKKIEPQGPSFTVATSAFPKQIF